MLKKVLIIGVYLIIAVILLVYRVPLIEWMDSNTVWYLDIFISLTALVIAIVPAIPYGVVAAIVGAKYGLLIGTVINIVISVLAAIILFVFVRVTFSEKGRQRAASKRGIVILAIFAERNAFLAILFARLLPILPAQLINIFAAITRIPWRTYVYATILGKIPFILLVTLLGDQFIDAPNFKGILITVGIYGMFMLIVYLIYRHFFESKTN